ncbi:CARDB domain-containing protein [Streptomyces sp. NPDC050315]|uniref:CARDB domain-containing protein n=1 Tax=Streptomyces sp. NPDC050315 TaxID=3155039 RepID=UPI0034413108
MGTTDDHELHKTFSHEMGHNLGLLDQYTPVVPGRNIGAWDIMDWDDPLPHALLVHRMMLGWVPPGWLRRFDFSRHAPIDQSVRLSPVEGGEPAPGTYAGIEIRIADGFNYYLEYRNGEAPDIGDRHLPVDDRILGTDVASPHAAPLARPSALLLRSDGDDSGPVLGNGDFYTETDRSDPLFPTDFRIDVSGIDGTKANVRIRYGVNARPDPSIRPGLAGPTRPWQSPDIEIRNAKSLANPAWHNIPWAGHPNTIAAQVKNRGDLNAPAVRVDFSVKDYNIGGAPEFYLGSAIHDVAAGATVEFTTSWVPARTGHYCVVARIPLYVVPTAPTVVEQTELNNLAQSNYDRFNAATASPSTREVTSCTVTNPYQQRTRVFIVAGKTNPLYRTFG